MVSRGAGPQLFGPGKRVPAAARRRMRGAPLRRRYHRAGARTPQLAGAGDGAVMVAGDLNAHIWLPPLFPVDHALTRGCRALVADIQLPN